MDVLIKAYKFNYLLWTKSIRMIEKFVIYFLGK